MGAVNDVVNNKWVDIGLAPLVGGVSLYPQAAKAFRAPRLKLPGAPPAPATRYSDAGSYASRQRAAAATAATGSASSILTDTTDPTGRMRRILLGE